MATTFIPKVVADFYGDADAMPLIVAEYTDEDGWKRSANAETISKSLLKELKGRDVVFVMLKWKDWLEAEFSIRELLDLSLGPRSSSLK
jgi:hypothetical protein